MKFEYVFLEGSFDAIGRSIGNCFKNKIRELVQIRKSQFSQEIRSQGLELSVSVLHEICSESAAALKNEYKNGYDELRGIASSSGVKLEELIFSSGYSDIIDLYLDRFDALSPKKENRPSCTSFISIGNANSDKLSYAGQTWDMPPNTQNFVFLAMKKPVDCRPFLSLSTVTGLTHIGINEDGLCIGTNKLVSSDVQQGLLFTSIIQNAISKNDLSEAREGVVGARRAAGHNYFLISKGEGLNIEASAKKTVAVSIRNDVFVHANHYLSPLSRTVGINYSPSSERRSDTLKAKLVASYGELNMNTFQSALSLHEGPICRHDNADVVQTCSGIIFNSESIIMRASYGPPHLGDWSTYRCKIR